MNAVRSSGDRRRQQGCGASIGSMGSGAGMDSKAAEQARAV